MHLHKIFRDARYFQIIFQSVFLSYGILFLHWQNEYWLYGTYFITGLVTQFVCEYFSGTKNIPLSERYKKGIPSVLITSFGLVLLLKTNHWWVGAFAAAVSIGSKYFFRVNGKHIFNPSALGIAVAVLFTGKAWISPGQWGSGAVIMFGALCLGFIVTTRVQKLDVSLAFLGTFAGLIFLRQIIYLGWPMDHFIQSVSTGSLLLFSFFMITDPKTIPNHTAARIVWCMAIAAVSFYLTVFKFMNGAPIFVLVLAQPFVPLLDNFFKAKKFDWLPSKNYSLEEKNFLQIVYSKSIMGFFNFKNKIMKKKLLIIGGLIAISPMLFSFCGFYVSKADGTLKNKTSQVILVRDGNKSVITMYNDFKGDTKDFAMVVPVPVVLRKDDIKVVDQSIFQRLNDYSAPRLVEYWDQNPCSENEYKKDASASKSADEVVVTGSYGVKRSARSVTVEAKYLVGEYDILILSAKESGGLKNWLNDNGYKIPDGAEEVLDPYIKSNLKFFVVKVNEKEKAKLNNNFLRPIQISFNSPKFMLPIRLGMANADGDQDLIVYAFTRKGRIECTNYRNTNISTDKNVPLFVQKNFGSFYGNLFTHQWAKEDKSVAFLEYAWDVSPQNFYHCDPCIATAPSQQDLVQSGVWWLSGKDWSDYSDVDNDEPDNGSKNVHFTRLHFRYNRKSFAQDLMFQVTPNTETFQARYVITHPAHGDFNCSAGKKYLQDLKARRKKELIELTSLTGTNINTWQDEIMAKIDEETNVAAQYATLLPQVKDEMETKNTLPAGLVLFGIAMLGGAGLMRWKGMI